MVPRCVTSHASPRANGGTRSLRQSALSRRSICTGRGRLDLPRQHPRVDVARATSRRLLRRQTDRAWVKARVQGRNCPLGSLLERRLRFSALAGAPGKREHESDDRCSGQVPSRAAQRPHRGRRYSTRSVGLRGSSTASARTRPDALLRPRIGRRTVTCPVRARLRVSARPARECRRWQRGWRRCR